jgi:magnesium transporter
MPYLSQIIGKPVHDASGEAFDTVSDLVIFHGTEKFPRITGILLSGDRSRVAVIPWDAVSEFVPAGIRLRVQRRHLTPRPLQPDEVLLRDDILDGQVVDTDDIKVVRVNDLELRQTGSEVRVVGADVSTRAILRRLGLEPFVCRALERVGRPLRSRVIPWNLVAVLGGTMTPLRLSISRQKLKDIHPADLAELLEELDRDERVEVMTALAEARAADVLEEAPQEMQTAVLQELPSDRASDILEEMPSDAAADALGELPEKRVEELISLMEEEKAEEVSRLLQYPPETAAGKMTTEFLALPESMTVDEVIGRLRETKPGAEMIYYLYVIDGQGRLVGVLSTRNLLVSPPATPISKLMRTEVAYVRTDASADDVAGALVKYDLLAVPVVEEDGRIVGIVTIDQVIDTLLEKYGPRRLGAGYDLLRRQAGRETPGPS